MPASFDLTGCHIHQPSDGTGLRVNHDFEREESGRPMDFRACARKPVGPAPCEREGAKLNTDARRRRWNSCWLEPSHSPFWHNANAEQTVDSLVQRGWIEKTDRLLDIGCGTGEITAAFARSCEQATGIDFAATAIDRANQSFKSNASNLKFRAIDFCTELPGNFGTFTRLFDRGCFHGIPPDLQQSYLRNILRCLRPAAKFCLICKAQKLDEVASSESEAAIRDHVVSIFSRHFKTVEILPMRIGGAQRSVAGLRFLFDAIE